MAHRRRAHGGALVLRRNEATGYRGVCLTALVSIGDRLFSISSRSLSPETSGSGLLSAFAPIRVQRDGLRPLPFADGTGPTLGMTRLRKLADTSSATGEGRPAFLEEKGIDPIQSFPASVIERDGDRAKDGSFAPNIVGLVDCIDREKSDREKPEGEESDREESEGARARSRSFGRSQKPRASDTLGARNTFGRVEHLQWSPR